MAMKDVIYPENKQMMLELSEMCGRIKSGLSLCFHGVNTLIDCIEKNFPGKTFKKIVMDASKTIQDNCSLITERVNEINKFVCEMKTKMEKEFGADLFKKLEDPNTNFVKVIASMQIGMVRIEGALITSGAVYLISRMTAAIRPDLYLRVLAVIGVSALGCVVVALIGIAFDTIVSLILGKIEKNELVAAVKEYKEIVDKFESEVHTFYGNVTTLTLKIQSM